MYGLTDYGWMLRDPRRIAAYTRALAAVVSADSIVVDLGCGIGTFGIIACHLGAARIYAVEPGEIIAAAEEIARHNDVADRICFVRGSATEVTLPEKADVVVSDLGGALPLFEDHIPAVIHARDRFLAPGGVLIPASDRLFCAPVSNAEWYAGLTSPWRSVPGLDLSSAESMALNTPRPFVAAPADLCGEPRCWAVLDYANIASPDAGASIEWESTANHVIHGFALWFETTLYGEITLASGPWSPESIHSTMMLPLLHPLETGRGDTLGLTIDARLISRNYVVTWHAETRTHRGVRQSTFFSSPLTVNPADLQPANAVITAVPEGGTWSIAGDVLSRTHGDDLVLLNLASGARHRLNGTGAEIWRSLAPGSSIDGIARHLVTVYEVELPEAVSAVETMLASLMRNGLVVWSAGNVSID